MYALDRVDDVSYELIRLRTHVWVGGVMLENPYTQGPDSGPTPSPRRETLPHPHPRGRVERRRAPRDERSLAVTLTERGRELRADPADRAAIVERLGMPLADLERCTLTEVIAASRAAPP